MGVIYVLNVVVCGYVGCICIAFKITPRCQLNSLCDGEGGLNVFAKSINPRQPAQADMQ